MVAVSAKDKFRYPTGKKGAIGLGYDAMAIQEAPAELLASFCGVGNPFALGKIRPGDTVLDIGCGVGFDLFVAGRLVGTSGRVCGIDLTEDMAARARENLASAGLKNFDIRQVDSEEVPYPDQHFDVVISNGAINLSPCKPAYFREIHRVLKPGGRLMFADVVLEGELPSRMVGSLEAWSQ